MKATPGLFLGLIFCLSQSLFAAPSGPVIVGVAGDPNDAETRAHYRILKETSGTRGVQLEWEAVAAGHAEVALVLGPGAKAPAGAAVVLIEAGKEGVRSEKGGRRQANVPMPAGLDGWYLEAFQKELFEALVWAAKRTPPPLPALAYHEAKLPNYEKVTPAPVAQDPLAPADSMRLAQVPPGFELQLFAAEPMVINPICLNWDERGRLWVVETVDYPNNLHVGELGHDRIKILTDTDGDGRADKAVVFAEGLSIPTSLTFSNGGVLVTNNEEMLFLKDTNGDDRADERKVIFKGFRTNDTHAGVSNLRYGFDNWLWATTGYAGFSGKVGGEDLSFSSGVFRFKADGSKLQFLQATTNNTWGLGFSEDGEVMGSTANSNPSWFLSVPDQAYARVGMEGAQTPRAENDATFYPITRDIRQVDAWRGPLRETGTGRTVPTSRNFTAGAGHSFYTDALYPERYRNRAAFVCEPTGHLVATGFVGREGADLHLNFTGENLFTSADAWSAPVAAEVGPDGAVWIADWYNLIIQHNPTPSLESAGMLAETGRGAAYVTPLRDTEHGRIYRVVPSKGAKAAKGAAAPVLEVAKWQGLVAGLKAPGMITRLHAQRLLVETRPAGAAKELLALTKDSGPAALHALWALAGADLLPPAELDARLHEWAQDKRPVIRRAAAQAGAGRFSGPELLAWMEREQDGMALKEVLLAISALGESEEAGRRLQAYYGANKASIKGVALREAFRVAAARHWWGFVSALRTSSGVTVPGEKPDILKGADLSKAGEETLKAWNVRIFNPQQTSEGDPKVAVVAEGRSGGGALKLASEKGVDMMVALPFVAEAGKRYRLSGWAKSAGVHPVGGDGEGGEGVMLSVRGPWSVSKPLHGDHDWEHLEVEFDAGPGGDMLVGGHLGYGGLSAGTAWFEDLQLRELDENGDESLFDALIQQVMHLDAGSERVAALRAGTDPVARYIIGTASKKTGAVKAPVVYPKEVMEARTRGGEIYGRICTACHQPHGRGLAPDFPPLAGSEWVNGPSAPVVLAVIHGLSGPVSVTGKTYNGIMPPNPTFTDQEVADVLTFIRTSFGNEAAPVSAAEVKALRARFADRKEMWKAEELKAAAGQ